MKRVFIFLLIAFLCGMGIPAQAKSISYTTVSVGKASQKYDWVQNTAPSPNGLFVLDGSTIKLIKGKSVQTYFDLKKLSSVLPKPLQNAESIRSFIAGQMMWHDGELYVSGFMFRNVEGKGIRHNDQEVIGETYNILFSLKNKKPTLIHQSISYYNKKSNFGDWYETPSGMPDNIYKFGNTYAIAYAQGRTRPHFTFSKDGSLIFAREHVDNHVQLYVDIMKYKNRKETKLYTVKTWQQEHISATLNGDILTIYYDYYISPSYPADAGEYSILEINLKTNQRKEYQTPDDIYFDKPLQYGNKMYFLNNNGVFSVYKSNGKWKREWLMRSKDIKLSVYIAGWNYDGNYIYITDFDKRAVHKIKP